MDNPASLGNAVRLIVVVTIIVVLAGSAVIWIFDRRDFPDYGTALWFSLETVTTVGYGDVTPTSAVGRLVAGVVMVVAIAFITVITAAVTSTFVEAAQRRRAAAEEAEEERAALGLNEKLDEISARLERIERSIGDDRRT